jgi:hypothetical protein
VCQLHGCSRSQQRPQQEQPDLLCRALVRAYLAEIRGSRRLLLLVCQQQLRLVCRLVKHWCS